MIMITYDSGNSGEYDDMMPMTRPSHPCHCPASGWRRPARSGKQAGGGKWIPWLKVWKGDSCSSLLQNDSYNQCSFNLTSISGVLSPRSEMGMPLFLGGRKNYTLKHLNRIAHLSLMISEGFVFCSQIWLNKKKFQFYSKCISNSKGSSAVVKIQKLTDLYLHSANQLKL